MLSLSAFFINPIQQICSVYSFFSRAGFFIQFCQPFRAAEDVEVEGEVWFWETSAIGGYGFDYGVDRGGGEGESCSQGFEKLFLEPGQWYPSGF